MVNIFTGMRNLTLVLTIFVFAAIFNSAQSQRWNKYRHEIQGGIGATSFLGELGGSKGPGKDLFLDVDGRSSRYLLTAGYRYKLEEYASVRGNITYGRLSGSDAFAGDKFRQSRNLSFRSPLIELAAVGEVYFIREKLSSRYKVRGIKGVLGSGLSAYLYGGLGGFFFNPRAKFEGNDTYPGDGKWYSLHELGTEGQNIPGGPKKYRRIGLNIPLGIGAKYNINRTWALSLEYGLRYTFTDYIDDVSTRYVNPALLEAQGGPVAAYFSDPKTTIDTDNDEFIIGEGRSLTGEQRGNPGSNDTYMFLTLGLNYKFVSKKSNRPKF